MKKIINLSLLSPVTISPILCLASCGTNYVEPVIMYNMLDESSLPKVDPIQTTDIMSQNEIASYYIENIKSNNGIFINDMVLAGKPYINVFKNTVKPEGTELTKFELGFSRPTFDTTTISHISAHDETLNIASFKQRINLVYEQDEGLVHYTQNISVDVEYKNIIFIGYESTDTDEPWCIGLFDDNVGAESFWYYQFDTKPWSVSYSCTNEQIKTIKDEEGGPSVDIHDNEYYSGMIDDTYKLYNTYLYANDLASGETIDQAILEMILLMNYRSTLIKNVGREADLRLSAPLYAYGDTESSSLDLNVDGFTFFKPSKAETSKGADITLKNGPIILNEADSSFSTVTLPDNATKHVDFGQYDQKYQLPAKYESNDPSPNPKKTFIIPVDSLTFNIKYYVGTTEVSFDITLSLHYTSLTMLPEPTPPEP